MANEGNLKPYKKGQSGNPAGLKPGTKRRSTIARKILEMDWMMPADIYKDLKEIFPGIEKRMSVEDIIYIKQAHQAIKNGDTVAAKMIIDSGYGAPKQEIEHSGEVEMSFDIGKINDDDLKTLLEITNKAKNVDGE